MNISELKQIPGCPCYYASRDGRIWTTKRKGGNDRTAGKTGEPRELSQVIRRYGYRAVSLHIDGKTVSRMVHALVLEAFVGLCPPGMEACHYPDSDKSNNSIENLRWDTHGENAKDKYRDRPETTHKTCTRCGAEKPVSEFYGDKRASDGLKTVCKPCHIVLAKTTRDPEKRRVANREYMRRWRAGK